MEKEPGNLVSLNVRHAEHWTKLETCIEMNCTAIKPPLFWKCAEKQCPRFRALATPEFASHLRRHYRRASVTLQLAAPWRVGLLVLNVARGISSSDRGIE